MKSKMPCLLAAGMLLTSAVAHASYLVDTGAPAVDAGTTILNFRAGQFTVTETVTIGFLFVMLVLCALALVTSTIGFFFARSAAKAASLAAAAALAKAEAVERAQRNPPGPAPTASADASEPVGEDPALLAVIAAAVHCVIGDRPHRVISIRRDGPGWAQEGRRQIFSSHRVR